MAPPFTHRMRRLRRWPCAPAHRSRRPRAHPRPPTPPSRNSASTIEGHYDNSLGSSDAASQGTIRAELLKSRPPLRPGEVLEFVPGVIVTQHSGDGKANQYFLRGFNLDHGTDFATCVDGMPVNMPTHGHGQGYTDLNFLIPELVERIDYRKGPYFASEGDFAARRRGRDRVLRRARRAVRPRDGRRERLPPRRCSPARSRVGGGALLLGASRLRNDGPWTLPEEFRKGNGVLRYARRHERDGWSITPWATTRDWNATDQIPQRAVDGGADRPLRLARSPTRRRRARSATACRASGTATRRRPTRPRPTRCATS